MKVQGAVGGKALDDLQGAFGDVKVFEQSIDATEGQGVESGVFDAGEESELNSVHKQLLEIEDLNYKMFICGELETVSG